MKLINQNWKTAYAASAKRGKIRGKRTPVIGYELIHVYHVTQNAPCQFKFFKAEQVSDVNLKTRKKRLISLWRTPKICVFNFRYFWRVTKICSTLLGLLAQAHYGKTGQ